MRYTLFSVINKFDSYNYDKSQARITILGKKAVRLRHSRNGGLFYTKPFPPVFLQDFNKEHWVKLIRRPPNIKNYLWPIDIVDLNSKNYALVFELREDLGGYESIADSLSNMAMDCSNIDINANTVLAKNLVEAWCKFDDCNYLYHEFSFSNMFCNMDNAVMFDFSFSTREYSKQGEDLPNSVKAMLNRIHPDYTDVYYYQRKTHPDFISDYFSMAVILFRLLIGILPYQGRLLEGIHNITKHDHAEWIKKYHQNPIFIFAQNDTNRISSTVNPDKYLERWNMLPPLSRGMFCKVFDTDNAIRKIKPGYFTPQDWKNVL